MRVDDDKGAHLASPIPPAVKAVRIQSKAIYRALKNENKPRIYRVEIR